MNDGLDIKEAQEKDLIQLLELYTHLHGNTLPNLNETLEETWRKIIADKNHHVLLGTIGGQAVASCVVVVIPNLTHNQRPYALVENVITHELHRRKGYASRLLGVARTIAEAENCYKIMLMTGSKLESTYRFYEKAGFNRLDKTAFVQWI